MKPRLLFAIGLGVCFMSSGSYGDIQASNPSGWILAGAVRTGPETLGVEFGNGKLHRIVDNRPGLYRLAVSSNWDAHKSGAFTEILSSPEEGIPRARMQISSASADYIRTIRDLIETFISRGWSEASPIAGKSAVERERVLGNGNDLREYRILRAPRQIIFITLDGRKGSGGRPGPFERMVSALSTIEFLE